MRIGRETKIGIFVASVLIAAFSVINYLRGEDIFGKEINKIGRASCRERV